MGHPARRLGPQPRGVCSSRPLWAEWIVARAALPIRAAKRSYTVNGRCRPVSTGSPALATTGTISTLGAFGGALISKRPAASRHMGHAGGIAAGRRPRSATGDGGPGTAPPAGAPGTAPPIAGGRSRRTGFGGPALSGPAVGKRSRGAAAGRCSGQPSLRRRDGCRRGGRMPATAGWVYAGRRSAGSASRSTPGSPAAGRRNSPAA